MVSTKIQKIDIYNRQSQETFHREKRFEKIFNDRKKAIVCLRC